MPPQSQRTTRPSATQPVSARHAERSTTSARQARQAGRAAESIARQTAAPLQRRHGLSDDEVRERVNTELLSLARTIYLRIEVGVSKGNVTLKGTVASAYERNLVVRTAREVDGVKSVADQIVERGLGAAHRPPTLVGLVFGGLFSVVALLWAYCWPAVGSTACWPRRLATVALAALLGWWNFWPATLEVVPVEGTLIMGGRPLLGAHLTLHPIASKFTFTDLPKGVVQPDGTIEWTTWKAGDGLPVGEFAVTVQVPPGSTPPLPADYTRVERTPLRVAVTRGGPPVGMEIRTPAPIHPQALGPR